MSYPSINPRLQEMGVTPETATDDQAQTALISAFQEDLSLGFDKAKELVHKLKKGNGSRANAFT